MPRAKGEQDPPKDLFEARKGPDGWLYEAVLEVAKQEQRGALPVGFHTARGLCAVAAGLGVDWPLLVAAACVQKLQGRTNHRPVDAEAHFVRGWFELPLFDAVLAATKEAWSVRRGRGSAEEQACAAGAVLSDAIKRAEYLPHASWNGKLLPEQVEDVAYRIVLAIKKAGRGRAPTRGFNEVAFGVLDEAGAIRGGRQGAKELRRDLRRSGAWVQKEENLGEGLRDWEWARRKLDSLLAPARSRSNGARSHG